MRVLVIEDELRMARLVKRALEEEGHAVDVAGDGPEGLWMATENPYTAIAAMAHLEATCRPTAAASAGQARYR
jgi:DNA-binding response OmpR family regulator